MTCTLTLSLKYGTNVKIRFLKLDLVEHVWNSSTQEFLFLRKRKEFDTLNVPFAVNSPSLSQRGSEATMTRLTKIY